MSDFNYAGIMATLVVYSGNGPLWSGIEAQAQLCRDNWWTNLLYINNIVKADEPVGKIIYAMQP